ncbi:unnamed protein product, partial [Brassica oleracea]
MYLADTKVVISAFSDMEVLDYWKDKQHRYGDLALLARDILSIPITTVASESAFSVRGRVLSPFRNRLLPKTVQALICTRNWLAVLLSLKETLRSTLIMMMRMLIKEQVAQEMKIQTC